MIVQGPYLVRNMSIDGHSLSLTGDWLNATTLEVFAPLSITEVTFNARKKHVTRTPYGSLVGYFHVSHNSIDSIAAQLPALDKWKVADGLPERNASYDDSRWVGKFDLANHSYKSMLNYQHRCGSYEHAESFSTSNISSALL